MNFLWNYTIIYLVWPFHPFHVPSILTFKFFYFLFLGGVLSWFQWEGLYCSCLTEMQCPLFRTSAHGPGCWFLPAWHKLQSSDQRSFSWVNASPRRPGGKSRVYSFECWMMWKGSCWATLEKVVLGIKQNRLNKPRQASQFGALIRGFSFIFCLQVPDLTCCLDFPQWWSRSWGL